MNTSRYSNVHHRLSKSRYLVTRRMMQRSLTSSTRATRWGVVSAGNMSADFVSALRTRPSEHQVVAVAARDTGRADNFARLHNIPKSYGSYKDLAKDPTIDVAYIGSIHTTHHEVAKMMINAGKAVLCEKPLTLNLKQNQDLIDCARRKGVLLMEGFWTRFFPAYNRMVDEIKKGTIGEVKVINLSAGFKMAESAPKWNYDVKSGGGVTMQMPSYVISMASSIFGEAPSKVTACGILNDKGVDMTINLAICYTGGRLAVATVSRMCDFEEIAVIHGTQGTIELPMPWCPEEVIVCGQKYKYPLPDPPEAMSFRYRTGLIYEANHIRELLLKGYTESPVVSHDVSNGIMAVLDQARAQMGILFDADSDAI